MGTTTDIITFNIKDLGRTHSGQKRAFNVPAFTKLINGAKVQEAVKNGDLVGYLGHDIRRNFGLRPPEVTINNGKVVPIDPAFTTSYIKAFDDGTVEHKARFLDTPLGETAQKWHESKTGGFSSVVAPDERNPTDFLGFDYVRMPNFNGNRGYVMDSADNEWGALTNRQKIAVLEGLNAEKAAVFDAMVQTVSNLTGLTQHQSMQAGQLLEMVADLERDSRDKELRLRDAQAMIKLQEPKFEPLMKLNVGSANWLTQATASFDSSERAAPRIYEPPFSIIKYFR